MTSFNVSDASGRDIQSGDTVTNFRGEVGVFLKVTRGPEEGRSAKVAVRQNFATVYHYAQVWGLTVTEADK